MPPSQYTLSGRDGKAHPYQSRDVCYRYFLEALDSVASNGGPAGVVTLLTQAASDPVIFERMRAVAQAHAQRMQSLLTSRLCNGGAPLIEAEFNDYMTISRFLKSGFPVAEEREVGAFRVRLMPGRESRPPGDTIYVRRHIYQPFDASKFHFNPERMRDFFVWIGEICGAQTGIYLQKYAFTPGVHGLICPYVYDYLPQYLTADLFDWVCTFARSEMLPNMKLAYNSLNSGASVNNMHCHVFFDNLLPVERSNWRHNGGSEEYPAQVMTFEMNEIEEARRFLGYLNQVDLAYNLLMTPTHLYFMVRQKTGAYVRSSRGLTFAVYEMSGVVLVTCRSDYETLTLDDILDEFNRIRV